MSASPRYDPKTGELLTPPGPFSSPHLLIAPHGDLPGGEHWSIGIRTVAATPDPGLLVTYAQYAAISFGVCWDAASSLKSINPAGVTCRGVNVRSLNAAGVTTGQAEYTFGTPKAGNAGSAIGPDQISLAVSLHTNLAGRHGKGRVYFPALCADLTDGRLGTAFTQGVATAVRVWLDDLTTENPARGITPATLWHPAVQSRTSGLAPAPITSVAVGDIPDTMRRRRAKLKEFYATSALNA